MAHFAVTAIGADRPGIVAALTGALYERGANLEDISSTILRGHFAMMLMVDAPEGVSAADLEAALRAAADPLGVSVAVRDVEAGVPTRPEATHVLVAYGADRPGIVARIARLLADRGVNITALSSRLVGGEPPESVYAMVAELALPPQLDPDRLGAELRSLAQELSVDVTFRPVEVETL
ncbi:MAG TPA: ACT domain-containing protein [Actinomycetota bacterium]|nr:ACT domain-containing protein [Actinomycetota bacterium]